ncbi:hypothetical protein ACS0TY_026609 [Phlomoides rotata]
MLRMDRVCFVRLCNLLKNLGGLTNSKHVRIREKVAMFFTVLVHHTKNMDCLGVIDRTHIDVQVPTIDKARYKNRKG